MKKIVLTLVGLLVMGWAMAQSGNHWTVITGTQYNMTVKGIIVIDGVTQTSDQLEIGAFYGDECRGSRKAAVFPITGEYTVMLTIVSNVYSGETITFRIYDHATQQELNLQSESTLVFEHNTNQGAMGNWFPFVFTTPEPPAFHFTTSGNWSEASNWQGGTLPSVTDAVIIDADCIVDQDAEVAKLTVSDGSTLTLQTSKTLTVSGALVNAAVTGIVIKDGAQLINASENVAATAEKDITAYGASNPDGWYTIASPVNEMAIAGSAFLTPNYDLYRFNENPDDGLEWENYKANVPGFTTFENGRGYLYANSNTFTPAFTGTLNAASVTRQLTCSENPDGLSGLNLIGNPFPHAIYKGAGGAIDNANLASGYYTLTNEGTWQVHTYEDAIMPGQGILVKTVANTDLTIGKNYAVATAENSGAKTVAGRLDITVKGDESSDRTFAYFGPGIGLEKMGGFDPTAPCVFIRSGQDYAISHVDNEDALELCFQNSLNSDFLLSVETKDAEFGYLYLVDLVTGEVTDLQEQPYYTFHATGDENELRFKLMFGETTGVNDAAVEAPFAFIANGQIVFAGVEGDAVLQVVDMTGRIVLKGNVSGNVSTTGLTPGVYVLRLSNGNGVKTQKIVVE